MLLIYSLAQAHCVFPTSHHFKLLCAGGQTSFRLCAHIGVNCNLSDWGLSLQIICPRTAILGGFKYLKSGSSIFHLLPSSWCFKKFYWCFFHVHWCQVTCQGWYGKCQQLLGLPEDVVPFTELQPFEGKAVIITSIAEMHRSGRERLIPHGHMGDHLRNFIQKIATRLSRVGLNTTADWLICGHKQQG